ncbi:ATP-binding protein [Asanoa sp. NPDC049573]|uniref:sensor histidine kinase n=1 Tax=Asanoa sp. NPDC049573 TaxID=3155396 RepID=UPI00342C5428
MATAGRLFVGVFVGAATAVAEIAFLCWAALVTLVELARRRRPVGIEPPARRLVEIERRRIATFLPGACVVSDDFTGRRAVAYLGVRWLVGLLGGFVVALFLYGVVTGAIWARDLFAGRSSVLLVTAQLVGGLVLLFLAGQGFLGVAALDRRLAQRMLVPSDRARYEQRISELAASRAGVVAAVDAERRRIERDLHDGVQQRLVALGLLLGQARRSSDRDRSDDLVRQAHGEAREILAALRDVAWRAYPADLDSLGLAEALSRVAERSGVSLKCAVDRLPPGVETAAYFVVSEAVTNAVKHAPGSRVTVAIDATDEEVRVTVTDDGPGGADPAGGGLSGLSRRAAALDGRLTVDSPPGGPTTILAVLPCG